MRDHATGRDAEKRHSLCRWPRILGVVFLRGAAALCSGCSLNNGIITGSNPLPAGSAQMGAGSADVSGRATQVAFISACAPAYGYAHDPAKLRTMYLNYEARQGATHEQLAGIEASYDSTYRGISELGSRKPSYCASKDGGEVLADLRRYQSGYFEARAPIATEGPDDWKKTRDSINCAGRC